MSAHNQRTQSTQSTKDISNFYSINIFIICYVAICLQLKVDENEAGNKNIDIKRNFTKEA